MAILKAHMSQGDFAERMRKAQGQYLRALRVAANLTQADVAKAMGYSWPAMVSEHEVGRTNLPPERYVDFARLVGVDPREFVKNILRWQNPWAFAVLWGDEPPTTNPERPKRVSSSAVRASLPSHKATRPKRTVK